MPGHKASSVSTRLPARLHAKTVVTVDASSPSCKKCGRAIQQAIPATQDQVVRDACVLIADSLLAILATRRAQIDISMACLRTC